MIAIMQVTPILKSLSASPFVQLTNLLQDVQVQTTAPEVNLTIGEPQHGFPEAQQAALSADVQLWQKYPGPMGEAAYRQAVKDWLVQRFDVADRFIDRDRHICACSGTREALFFLGLITQQRKQTASGQRPAVLLPNPYYHSYAAAALFAGAEPILVPATAETGFMPDFEAIPEDILSRTILAYFCHPANPQGALASPAQMAKAYGLARQYDFLVAFDECYSEIYLDDAVKPGSAIELAEAQQDQFSHMVILHSLSKRSSAAGMRCGFVAGDAEVIAALSVLISRGGAPVPLPLQRMGANLWRDETHVQQNRAFYRQNFALASDLIDPAFIGPKPDAGFFLWMTVPGTQEQIEKLVQDLWAQEHIKVIPGHFMAESQLWQGQQINPGLGYLRVALVQSAEVTRDALQRMNQFLTKI